MKQCVLLLSFYISFGTLLVAQSSYQFGLMPTLNFSKKLVKNWKLDAKIQSRQQLKNGIFGELESSGADYLLTDFALIASKKVGLSNKLAGGYLMRVKEVEVYHRLMQQFTLVQYFNAFRLAHRFAADQTIVKNNPLSARFRYRITAEFPLNGLFVDSKEFYWKLNHEYLNKFKGDSYDLELRLAPFLGYLITDTNKLEIGLNYRISAFINESSKHSFWIGVNWYLKI